MSDISEKLVYKTIAKEAREVLIEKKSKFIASVKPCCSEEEALAFLAAIRKEFSDASHNVYAYSLNENQMARYSDDGEPSQTAGLPVLDVIRKEELTDTAVVVTRYFGGTLLGTGGLVHAYTSAANLGIHAAGIITKMLCNVISVKADYTMAGKIQHKVTTEHLILDDVAYTDEVTFYICVLPGETETLLNDITELTNGKAVCTVIDTRYIEK